MTISKPTTKAASNGNDILREHGMRALREMEAKALIGLACDALHETTKVGHDMHMVIFDRDEAAVPDTMIRDGLQEMLDCMQTAEHYLRMLDSVFYERTGDSQAPWPVDSAL